MGRSKATSLGRAGEYLVAHLLELAGVEAYRVDGDFDLILNASGTLMRLEVKASSGTFKPRGSYRFFISDRNADAYAFVALDLGMMRLRLAEEMVTANSVSMIPERFTAEAQAEDIQKLLDKLREIRKS